MALRSPQHGSHVVPLDSRIHSKISCVNVNGTSSRASPSKFKNLILDIGGVLLQPNVDISHGTSVPPRECKSILQSNTWFQYQMGKLSSEEVFQQLAVETGYAAQDIRSLNCRIRESLAPLTKVIDIVVQLSDSSKVRLFGMTNCSADDFEFLEGAFPDLFRRFERTFTSAAVGMRKPNADYFRHVLRETGIRPSETLFVDDTLSNIITAEVLGFTTVLAFPKAIDEAVRSLVFYLRTEDERLTAARNYLERARGLQNSVSLTSESIRVAGLFDNFMIANALQKEEFLPVTSVSVTDTDNGFTSGEREWTRNVSKNAFHPKKHQEDLESTAVALVTLYQFSKVDLSTINTALDIMEKCVNDDGIFQVYFDPLSPCVDHVTAVKVVYLFHLAGRTNITKDTEEYIFAVLCNRAYLRGSPYYPSPEAFLYHLSDLVCRFKSHFEKAGFPQRLASRLTERIAMEGDALAIAMRILACANSGLPMTSLWREKERLAKMQNADGSWNVSPFRIHRQHDPESWLGNEALTTAFALAALEC